MLSYSAAYIKRTAQAWYSLRTQTTGWRKVWLMEKCSWVSALCVRDILSLVSYSSAFIIFYFYLVFQSSNFSLYFFSFFPWWLRLAPLWKANSIHRILHSVCFSLQHATTTTSSRSWRHHKRLLCQCSIITWRLSWYTFVILSLVKPAPVSKTVGRVANYLLLLVWFSKRFATFGTFSTQS